MTDFASKSLTAGQLNSLVKKVGGHEQVLRILSGELKIEILVPVMDQGVSEPASQFLSVDQEVAPEPVNQFLTIESNLSFRERVTRGQYNWQNSDLTEDRFPVAAEQIGCWEWKLFHFDRDISFKEVWQLTKEEGFTPGAIGHILAFGESFPEEQRKYPIIGLGSVAEVGLEYHVPGLWLHDDGRILYLHCSDDNWARYYRFLGVRRRPEVSDA